MSRLNVVRRCYNCNAILQENDPQSEGYISPGHLDQVGALVLFCDHCYEQQKYNFSSRTISSTMVFHWPQPGHLPSHFAVS